ncbi:MAG: sigma 54-interacting transcriptional regulator [Deltaproteobacteria bacterium]|nr:sigma 54-interacting transcriptional regulator [Deltaproteobacteria bacterium]MBW2137978.1 sigma 54-interacting transcriptional regulator [Deltaproteobacteria bacterium]
MGKGNNKTNGDRTQIILDSIADGVFTVDSDLKITSFNRAAERITGIKKEQALGRHCWEVFRANICERQCALKETMRTGQQIVNQSIFIVTLEGERVPISISTALLKDPRGRVIGGVETFRDLSLVEELRKELSRRHNFFDIISKNKEMQRLFNILEQVSESNTTVLLEGESGTGKELFAKAIHSLSPRKDGPLITVNCGSLPDTLLESELFGYKAGAFTDARKDKPGRLALAKGGTLFLDEIGDISPALQVRLLRVLQDRTYEPLGSTRAEMADVRIVAATNKNLDDLVAKGLFRKDLYYRVNVVKLVLPPLRKKKEDIPLLAEHFIRKFNRLNNREIYGLSPEVLQRLMSHDFPGNVRELENILEYASVVCKNHYIGIEHLPDYLLPAIEDGTKALEGAKGRLLSWDDMQRELLTEVLKVNKWNRKATAAQLGVHPTTLWRKIKRLDIRIPKQKAQERE